MWTYIFIESVCTSLETLARSTHLSARISITSVWHGVPARFRRRLGCARRRAEAAGAAPTCRPTLVVACGEPGTSSGCVPATRELILAIIQEPENYYVNVHTLPLYGAGAVRGQLSK